MSISNSQDKVTLFSHVDVPLYVPKRLQPHWATPQPLRRANRARVKSDVTLLIPIS